MAEVKYRKSIKRLEEVIEKIENEDIDIGALAAYEKEAVNLIESCQKRLKKAEVEVKKVVDGFKSGSDKS